MGMKMFIDTEFNGFGGELLSIALATLDTDRVFYRKFPLTQEADPWVVEHVLPFMDDYRETPQHIDMQRWINSILVERRENEIEVVADWPEDIKHFCDQMIVGPGERINFNNSADPYITFSIYDFDNIIYDLGDSWVESISPHNAAFDAIANALNFQSWMQLENKHG